MSTFNPNITKIYTEDEFLSQNKDYEYCEPMSITLEKEFMLVIEKISENTYLYGGIDEKNQKVFAEMNHFKTIHLPERAELFFVRDKEKRLFCSGRWKRIKLDPVFEKQYRLYGNNTHEIQYECKKSIEDNSFYSLYLSIPSVNEILLEYATYLIYPPNHNCQGGLVLNSLKLEKNMGLLCNDLDFMSNSLEKNIEKSIHWLEEHLTNKQLLDFLKEIVSEEEYSKYVDDFKSCAEVFNLNLPKIRFFKKLDRK